MPPNKPKGKINKTDVLNNAITYDKLQNAVADGVVLGNVSGADSPVAELDGADLAGLVSSDLLIDEDDFASDSDTKAPTQQSTKAYVDAASSQDVVLLDTQTASSSASIDFTGLSSTYHTYEIRYANVVPATDGSYLGLRTSTDAGSSYDSGASDYTTQSHGAVGGTTGGASFTGTYARLAYVPSGSAANEQANGNVVIIDPSASERTNFTAQAGVVNTVGQLTVAVAAGYRASTTAVNAMQVIFSSGNIASGTFRLYGYK